MKRKPDLSVFHIAVLIFSGTLYLASFMTNIPISLIAAGTGGLIGSWQAAFWMRWRELRREVLEVADRMAGQLNEESADIDGCWDIVMDTRIYPGMYRIVVARRGMPVHAWRGMLFRHRRGMVVPAIEELEQRRSMIS